MIYLFHEKTYQLAITQCPPFTFTFRLLLINKMRRAIHAMGSEPATVRIPGQCHTRYVHQNSMKGSPTIWYYDESRISHNSTSPSKVHEFTVVPAASSNLDLELMQEFVASKAFFFIRSHLSEMEWSENVFHAHHEVPWMNNWIKSLTFY